MVIFKDCFHLLFVMDSTCLTLPWLFCFYKENVFFCPLVMNRRTVIIIKLAYIFLYLPVLVFFIGLLYFFQEKVSSCSVVVTAETVFITKNIYVVVRWIGGFFPCRKSIFISLILLSTMTAFMLQLYRFCFTMLLTTELSYFVLFCYLYWSSVFFPRRFCYGYTFSISFENLIFS